LIKDHQQIGDIDVTIAAEVVHEAGLNGESLINGHIVQDGGGAIGPIDSEFIDDGCIPQDRNVLTVRSG
jgi:hypothetical protein